MAKNQGAWGLEMGVCSMKAIRLEMQNGSPVATHYDFIDHAKILSQPENLQDQDKMIKEALLKFLSRNKVRGDLVCLSVSSQSGLARFVKLPPVEENKIAEIVRFEAKQQIPFPLNEVVWDFQKLGSGMVIDGLALDSEIGLFAMKRDFVNKTLQHYRDVNIDLHAVQMAPLALINYIAFDVMGKNYKADGSPAIESDDDDAPKKGILGLDIGNDISNLVLTDGTKIIEQRSISIGGSRFTKEIAKEFKLTFVKAEHLKRTVAKAAVKDGPDLKAVITAVKPIFQDLVGELQRSLTYFSNRHRNIEFEYMLALGNGFKLHGLQRFLQEKLSLEIRKPGKFERLQGDSVIKANNFSDNLLTFAGAYGLALQGLKQVRMTTNLLPPEIVAERQLKMKRPWAVAAAAAVLIGLSTYSLKNHLQARAWTDKSVTDSIKDGERIISNVGKGKKNFEQAKSNVAKEESNVKSLLSGQDERFNWLELFTYLNDALPRQDGKNLSDQQRAAYWNVAQNRPRGEVAYKELVRRQTLSRDEFGNDGYEPGDSLGKNIDQLIEFNIESVDCKFTENLSGFWQQVKGGGKSEERKVKEDVRPIEHWEKSPDGSGWVVELRGYTFHQDQKRFVQEVLLENLVRYGIVKNAPANNAEAAPAGASSLPDMGPVVNRVSHVLVYKYLTKKTNERTNFEIIGQSYLANAMRAGGFGEGGGAPGGPGMPPGGPGMMPGEGGGAGPSRDGWTPVGSTGSAASSGGLGRGGMMGGVPGESPIGPGGATTATTTGARSNHTRTEFVIFFIWKEPTPSDAMRATAGEGDPITASPADVTTGGSGLTSTGPGKGAPRGVIDPLKKITIGRPRGDAPGNRPFWNQPAAPAVPPPQ
ncbi:MAG: type IV pilus assembly protein PilM [Planctomycetes bacterium]|nr:type IV pilus assembly protein PilM [Planctomycetota bacterium]